jgi:integrase
MPRAFKKAGTFQANGWYKMVNGERKRVHCRDLGLPEEKWTAALSYQAAIAYWEKIFAPAKPILDSVNQQLKSILDGMSPADLEWLARQGAEARRVLDILEAASVAGKIQPTTFPEEGVPGPMPIAALATLPVPKEIITSALAGDNPFYSDDDNPDELEQIGQILAKPKTETTFTLRHHADKLLAKERVRDTKATTYAELKRYIDKLVEILGNDLDARTINEAIIEDMYLKIKSLAWNNLIKRKVWRIFQRLVKYLFKSRLFPLPLNLDDKSFSFKILPKKIKRYTKKEVKDELAGLPERLRLYALLGLNCGMLGVDMAAIRWAELDQKEWRIRRKRTKTGENADVPEVDYKLWPCTAKLLKKHLSQHDQFVLTSKTNTVLWRAWTDDTGKPKKKDLIVLQWKRHKAGIPLKAFRSIGSTIIGDHENYGRYAGHYLGHSVKSIADKHYVAPNSELFDEIMTYVGKELGLVS